MKLRNTSLRLVLTAGLSLGVLPQAFAAGTTAGQTISNTATVAYKVGTVDQDEVSSNTHEFLVDRVVRVTVAEVGGAATQVIPGAARQITTFTVTNTSNSPLDFRLDAANRTGDDFQLSNLIAYVESGATAGYQPLEDKTYIDELAADATVTVIVIGDVPSSVQNGQQANVTLTAIAAQSTNGSGAYLATPNALADDAVQTNVGTADNLAFIDTVFGDAQGDTDALRDGAHSDSDSYEVVTATLTVSKSSRVITDPFNCTVAGNPASCTSEPKAIPGAVVEYCLDVNNTGAATANSIVLSDDVPTNTTYVGESIRVGVTGTGAACDTGTGTAETDAAGGDAEFDAAGNGAVTIRSSSIAAASRFKAVFRVTVD